MEVGTLVIQLRHLYLQEVFLLILGHNLVLSDHNSVLGELISLLEVDNQFVLSLYHYFVIFNLLFVHYDFVTLVLTDTIHKVIQRLEFDV